MKGKIDKLDFFKIKIFCALKGTIKKLERQRIECENYLQITVW
jgi:hypothetical protein